MTDLLFNPALGAPFAPPHVVIRCAGTEAGIAARLGRCLALARTMKSARGLEPLFALDTAEAVAAVRAAGFAADHRPVGYGEALWLETLCALNGAAALVLDADEGEVVQTDIARWRAAGLVILTLDDTSARRLSADIAVYASRDPRDLSWFGFRGELLCGPEWAVGNGHAAARLGAMVASRIGGTARLSA